MKKTMLAILIALAWSLALPAQQPAVDGNLIVFLSDIHALDKPLLRREGSFETMNNFRTCVKHVLNMSPRPATAVFLGDVTEDGSEIAYSVFKENVVPFKNAGVRCLVIPGNHDSSRSFAQAFPAEAAASPVPGKTVAVLELPAAAFIFLDTTDPGTQDGYYGSLGEKQSAWLTETLKRFGSKPVFLCGHHSLDMMREMPDLKSFPALHGWVCGHLHQFGEKMSKAGIPQFFVPSTGFQTGSQPLGFVTLRVAGQEFVFTLFTVDPADARNGKCMSVQRKAIAAPVAVQK